MSKVTLSKSRDREGCNGGVREKEPAALRKQHSKERRDWGEGESETGPGEHLKLYSKGKHVNNVEVICETVESAEKTGYSN